MKTDRRFTGLTQVIKDEDKMGEFREVIRGQIALDLIGHLEEFRFKSKVINWNNLSVMRSH